MSGCDGYFFSASLRFGEIFMVCRCRHRLQTRHIGFVGDLNCVKEGDKTDLSRGQHVI